MWKHLVTVCHYCGLIAYSGNHSLQCFWMTEKDQMCLIPNASMHNIYSAFRHSSNGKLLQSHLIRNTRVDFQCLHDTIHVFCELI
eukprot:c16317_g1_i1 orf=423-677(+)